MVQATQTQTGRHLDAIAIEVVRNGLAAIADEMGATHVRAAYSSVVRESLDFSTAVCDGKGRVVAQGLSLALQLGAIPRFMQHVRERLAHPPAPGDVYLLNHPWQGGVHLPDFFFAKPVFVGDDAEPIAYTVIVSHMVDVGGPHPGGVAVAARSLWDEGLVLPLVPLVQRDVPNQVLLDVIAANTRDPDKVLGDIRSVLAGLEAGARQVLDLARRTGPDRLGLLMDQLLEATETATRAAIAALPDGIGEAEDYLDDDGRGGPPLVFRCRVDKCGEHLRYDFSGTADQVPAGINCTIADTLSVVTFVTRAALGGDLPVNEGFTRCLDYFAPEGCMVNASYPAAVGSRAAAIYRMCDVAMGALAELAPERIPANDGGPAVVYMSGHSPTHGDYIVLDYVQAGWGATSGADGVAAASHPISNAGSLPVEIAEEEAPVRIHRFSLAQDSSGVGTHVGAPAVEREYESLADGLTINYRLDRCLHAPQGTQGGGPGTTAAVRSFQNGTWSELPGKGQIVLNTGDRLHIRLAAGGGFGAPSSRAASAVEADLLGGLISDEHAALAYGRRVDAHATVTSER